MKKLLLIFVSVFLINFEIFAQIIPTDLEIKTSIKDFEGCNCPTGYQKLGKLCMPSSGYISCIQSGGNYENEECVCEYGKKDTYQCLSLLEEKKDWCEKTMQQSWDSVMKICKFSIIKSGGSKEGKCSEVTVNEITVPVSEGSSMICINSPSAIVNSPCELEKGCWVKGFKDSQTYPSYAGKPEQRLTARKAEYGQTINIPNYPNRNITVSY